MLAIHPSHSTVIPTVSPPFRASPARQAFAALHHTLPKDDLRPLSPNQLQQARPTPRLSPLVRRWVQLKRFVVRQVWAWQLERTVRNPNRLKVLAERLPGLNLPDTAFPVQSTQNKACFSLRDALLSSQVQPPADAQVLKERLLAITQRLRSGQPLNKTERITFILSQLARQPQTAALPLPGKDSVTVAVERLQKVFRQTETVLLPLTDCQNEHPDRLVRQTHWVSGLPQFWADPGLVALNRHGLWDKVLQPPSEQVGKVGWLDNSLKDCSVYQFCNNMLLIDHHNGALAVVGFGPAVKAQQQQGMLKRESTRTASTLAELPQWYPLMNLPGADGRTLYFNADRPLTFQPQAHQHEFQQWQHERRRAFGLSSSQPV